MYQVVLMPKTETSLCTESTERSTNNGISSTLTNTQKSQRRENLTKTSVFTLRDLSILSQSWHQTDTLIGML
jgi:hypothetical protein